MPQPRDGIGLRARSHGLTLPHAALHEAALTLVKVDQPRDGHLFAFELSLAGGIITSSDSAEKRARLASCLFHCQRAEAPNGDKTPWRRTPSPVSSVSDNEAFGPTLLHSQTKARQLSIPNVIPFRTDLRRIHLSLCQQHAG
jgi:hypothetical protein